MGTAKGEPSKTVADLAGRATKMIKHSDFAGAERLVRSELDGVQLDMSHIDALYSLAVAERYQQKFHKALETLEKLLSLNPGYGRGHQEKGYTLLALKQADKARLAFEYAVRFNPALQASWKELTQLYEKTNLTDFRRAAQQQLSHLSSLPKELVSVSSMTHEGKLYKAERLCRHFLLTHKHHVEAMRLLAAIGNELGIFTDAELLLDSCLEFDPNHDHARYDYANLLLKMQKFESAYKQTRILVRKQPGNLAYRSLLANAAAGIGDHKRAIDEYNKVLKKSPRQNNMIVMRGHAEKTIGDLGAAIRSYKSAYKLQPDYGDAFWAMANTKNYRFTDGEIEHMAKYEASEQTSLEDRIHICFALGKALEDRDEYKGSFGYYSRGNALKNQSVQHKSTDLNMHTSAQMDVYTADFFAKKKNVGCPAVDPIFIVGMPRAGSTLLEQILASHSSVKGTHELPNIIALVQRLRGSHKLVEQSGSTPKYPHMLTEIEDDYFRRFGEQYIEDTRVYRQGANYFIDKNPNNFFNIGLIRLILPNAKIIDARRHPMACCFSGFKQLFGQGQEFSYGLKEIGNYYREYVELMEHWENTLPGFVLKVEYEDVVDDLEYQVKRMLEFCKLPFEDACLQFHQTKRSVRTPSSEQVRQPIYRSGLDYWRNYEPWLDPLVEALGSDLRCRYNLDEYK